MNLRNAGTLAVSTIFQSSTIEGRWNEARAMLDTFSIPDGTGGVNPGDRRAVYYLISALKPLSVLEIGTHVGASTVHIASALATNQKGGERTATLTTVDISDVNSTATKPWLKYGAKCSPREMIDILGLESIVEFVHDTSLEYASRCNRKFDFIFLDGDHAARSVYSEVPAALNMLNPNGVILLHDYFPDMKPLWQDGWVAPGPFMATSRFMAEGADISVVPLGALPWPTKLKSNVTSLALLLKRG
jgi:predicted O-methyltransferase YrrM